MTISIILLDTGMNAVMIVLAVRLAGIGLRPWRILTAALGGAGLAAAIRGLGLSRGQTLLLWLPIASGMMAIACGRSAYRHPVRAGVLLLCAAGLLGGVILALSGVTGSLTAAYALGGLCTLVIGLRAIRAGQAAQSVCRVRMICRYREETAELDAMIDSGNTLRDYLTHLPVIVMPEGTGRRCFHLGDAPLRPIFADTAGGKQMMGILALQEIRLEADGKRKTVRAVVALSPGMEEGAPALVPAQLLNQGIAEESMVDQKQRGI